jgi:predicted DNA-binding antitoxin AbrB/MazE fold protein
MAHETIEAIFANGTLRILHPDHLSLREGQRVRIVIETDETPDQILALAAQVYDGLTPEDQTAVEQIALDRRSFFGERS